VYETVDFVQKLPHSAFVPVKAKFAMVKIRLGEIINIHNINGLMDISQVSIMIESLKKGQHIYQEGIPNIKMVKARNGSLLLFDGHHSLLAYMSAGKIFLNEIPHMIIYEKKSGFIEESDVLVFFGKHAQKIKQDHWQQWVINWQETGDKQLGLRLQRNMGELFNSFKEKTGVV
jgi:hypothetical protein